MKCIALFDSGNIVYKLDSVLEKKGYKFEVISTPSHIAKAGCSLCLKFPEEYLNVVLSTAHEHKTPIRGVYRVMPGSASNKYKRISLK